MNDVAWDTPWGGWKNWRYVVCRCGADTEEIDVVYSYCNKWRLKANVTL